MSCPMSCVDRLSLPSLADKNSLLLGRGLHADTMLGQDE